MRAVHRADMDSIALSYVVVVDLVRDVSERPAKQFNTICTSFVTYTVYVN